MPGGALGAASGLQTGLAGGHAHETASIGFCLSWAPKRSDALATLFTSLGYPPEWAQRADLLALDDWGLAPLTAAEGRELLEVLEDRCQTRSTVVASQVPVVLAGVDLLVVVSRGRT